MSTRTAPAALKSSYRAAHHLQRALLHVERNELDLAQAELEQASARLVSTEAQSANRVNEGLRIATARCFFVLRHYDRALRVLQDNQNELATKLELAARLEWNFETIETARVLLAASPSPAVERHVHLQLAKLFARHRAEDLALPHIDALLEKDPNWFALRLQRAELALWQDAKAKDSIVRLLDSLEPQTTELKLNTAWLLMRAGAAEEAVALLKGLLTSHPNDARVLTLRAELALWLTDLPACRAHTQCALQIDPENTAALSARGACNVLYGDAQTALVDLDRAIALGREDAATFQWRAEARVRLGQYDEALDDLHRALGATDGYLFATNLLRLLCNIYSETKVHRLGYLDYAELLDGLVRICPHGPAMLANGAPRQVATLLEEALAALGGNRTATLTCVHRSDDGRASLVPFIGVTAPRHASRVALNSIRVRPPREVLTTFEALIEHYPESPLPLCHRGELLMWLGEYASAREDLEETIGRFPRTRWAYYGLATLDILQNDPHKALATLAEGVRALDDTVGPAIYGIRGEAHRLVGNMTEARADLEMAGRVSPGRLAAFVNLALLYAQVGEPLLTSLFDDLLTGAPGLFSDAGLTLSNRHVADKAPFLTRALAMMRGNRSSSVLTYFTANGALRFVPGYRPAAQRKHGHTPNAPDANDLMRVKDVLRRSMAQS